MSEQQGQACQHAMRACYESAIHAPYPMVIVVLTDDGTDVGVSLMLPKGWTASSKLLDAFEGIKELLHIEQGIMKIGTIAVDTSDPSVPPIVIGGLEG